MSTFSGFVSSAFLSRCGSPISPNALLKIYLRTSLFFYFSIFIFLFFGLERRWRRAFAPAILKRLAAQPLLVRNFHEHSRRCSAALCETVDGQDDKLPPIIAVLVLHPCWFPCACSRAVGIWSTVAAFGPCRNGTGISASPRSRHFLPRRLSHFPENVKSFGVPLSP